MHIMDHAIKGTLRELGLTDGETRVYFALLGKGETTVGPIIDKAHISSSKVYVILEKLIQKGLVNYIMKDKTRYFQASPPVALVEFVEHKERELGEIKKQVNEAVKLIEEKQKKKQPTEQAKIYRGYKGLKSAWLEAMKSIPDKGEYFFLGSRFITTPVIDRFFNDVARRLKKRKIKLYGTTHKSQKKYYKEKENNFHYKMVYTALPWPADFTIAGDFVLINDLTEEPVVYSIKSKLLAESYKAFIKKVRATKF